MSATEGAGVAGTPVSVEERAHEDDGHHPDPKFYWLIGFILVVITAAEVAVYYIDVLQRFDVQILVPLSTAKFVLVVMFYMHLKFDSKLFSGVFLAPLALAVTVVVSLFILFTLLPFFPAR